MDGCGIAWQKAMLTHFQLPTDGVIGLGRLTPN